MEIFKETQPMARCMKGAASRSRTLVPKYVKYSDFVMTLKLSSMGYQVANNPKKGL